MFVSEEFSEELAEEFSSGLKDQVIVCPFSSVSQESNEISPLVIAYGIFRSSMIILLSVSLYVVS